MRPRGKGAAFRKPRRYRIIAIMQGAASQQPPPVLPCIDGMISNDAFWAVHSPHQDALHQLADHDDLIAAMRTEIVDMERRLQQMKTDLNTKQSQRDSLVNHAAQLQGVLEGLKPRLKYNTSMARDVNVSIVGQLGRQRGVAAQACQCLRASVEVARELGMYKAKVLCVAAGGGAGADGRVMGYTILGTSDGVVAFGDNQEGQLGLGHTDIVLRPVLVGSMAGRRVVAVVTGQYHTVMCTNN